MSLHARITHIERELRRLDRQAEAAADDQIKYIISEKFLPAPEGIKYGPDHVFKDLIFTVPGSWGKK